MSRVKGNRTFARITQAPTRAMDGSGQPIEPPQWVPHVNDRSWLYAYDGLNRLALDTPRRTKSASLRLHAAARPAARPGLVDADLGSLDDFNAGLLTGGTGLPGGGTAPVPGTTEWSLDNLGNRPWTRGSGKGSELAGRECADDEIELLAACAVILEGSLPLPGLLRRRMLLEVHEPHRAPPLR